MHYLPLFYLFAWYFVFGEGKPLCSTKKFNITGIPSLMFDSPIDGTAFHWNVGFCNFATPVEPNLCQSPSYLQQYRDGECAADFTRLTSVKYKDNRVSIALRHATTALSALITINCNPLAVMAANMEMVDVLGDGDNAIYTLRFNHACACGDKCVSQGAGMTFATKSSGT